MKYKFFIVLTFLFSECLCMVADDYPDPYVSVNYIRYTLDLANKTAMVGLRGGDKNSQVDIGDAVTIVNYLVGKTASLSRSLRTVVTEREPQ